MPSESPIALGQVVEDLVAESTNEERERRLLELPLRLDLARAAALWRLLPPPPGSRTGGWRELRALGPRDELPGLDEVLTAQAGAGGAPSFSTPGRRVLFCELDGAACALTLGGVGEDRASELDLVEAVLVAFAAIEEASRGPTGPALLESVAAPLPSVSSLSRQLPADMRHDVRHHLASIRTTQELLRRYGLELTAEEREHFAALLEREVRRASGLLLRATATSGPGELGSNGAVRVGPGLARVADVVRDVVRSEEGSTREAGQELLLSIETPCDALLAALDEIDLERILRNLIVNAREAIAGSRSGALIRVALRAAPGCLVLVVEDDGPGIPERERERVLEPGYSRGKPQGTGLGLAVVQGILEAWGGELAIGTSDLGGARLEARLPAANGEAEASA